MELTKEKINKIMDQLETASDMVHSSPQAASELIDKVVSDLEVYVD